MAARRLGCNLAQISGSVHGGALDLAAGTIEAWHARNVACGSGASANVGDVDDAAAVDHGGNADARGRSRRPDGRCRMAGSANPSGGTLPRRQQHRHRRAHHCAEARPTARPADRGREPRRRKRQYRRRCSRQGCPRRLHDRHRHREHASGRRQSRHQPALRSDQGLRTGGHDRKPALCARALSGPARARYGAVDRARQGEARRAQLWLRRRRVAGPPRHRAVCEHGGREHDARALQKLGAIDD